MNSSFRSLRSSDRKFPVRFWLEKIEASRKPGVVPVHLRISASNGSFLPLVSGVPSPLNK